MGATDGEIGKVDEFYFDDETWTIRYLIVKTGGWLMERKVLISPGALKEPDWENRCFPVNLTKSQIKHSPDIDTEKPVSRQHELELYRYYGWPYGDPQLRSVSEIRGYRIHAVDVSLEDVKNSQEYK